MFLTEIEEILDIIPIEQFRKVYKGLFKQISKCIDSNHFQVAERALMLWQNDYITNNLIPDKIEEILKILLPILSKHSKSHWNRNVQILVLNSLECFMTIDPVIFDSCVASLSELEMKSIERRKKLFYCWKSIDQNLNLNSKIINDEARDQLYLLLNDDNGVIDDEDTACINDKDYCINDKDTCINDKDNPIITTTTTTNTTNATTKITSATSTLPQVSIKKGTRRKSILPVDKNVYQELVDYSRSSSPRPDSSEDDNMEE
jgi:serine/threonine-protein phosphatase 2A regulatory subunit B'